MTAIVDGNAAWARLGLTMAAGVVASVGMWTVVLILPAAQAEFAVDRASASLPYTFTMLGFALGNLVLGRTMDRYGAAAVLIGAAAALGLGYLGAALAPSLWALTAAQAVIGFASAAGFGPIIADVSHWFLRRRGVAVAMAANGNYLAGVIWPLALAPILAAEGWRETYLTVAVACALLLPPLALTLRRRLPVEARAAAGARAAAAAAASGMSPRALQVMLALSGLGCCVAMAMPQVHIVALCVDLGYGVTAGAEMLALMLAGGVLSRLASGFLADWLGGLRTLLIGATAQAVALMLYIPFDGLTSLYVVSLIFGLSQGGIVPSYAMIVREFLPPAEAGKRVGVVIMATVLGMALGGWLSGLLYDLTGGYTAAFVNGVAWNLVPIGVTLFLIGRSGPRPQPVAA